MDRGEGRVPPPRRQGVSPLERSGRAGGETRGVHGTPITRSVQVEQCSENNTREVECVPLKKQVTTGGRIAHARTQREPGAAAEASGTVGEVSPTTNAASEEERASGYSAAALVSGIGGMLVLTALLGPLSITLGILAVRRRQAHGRKALLVAVLATLLGATLGANVAQSNQGRDPSLAGKGSRYAALYGIGSGPVGALGSAARNAADGPAGEYAVAVDRDVQRRVLAQEDDLEMLEEQALSAVEELPGEARARVLTRDGRVRVELKVGPDTACLTLAETPGTDGIIENGECGR